MTEKTAREVTDRDIGWFAGILDGEGTVTFGKTKHFGKGNNSVNRIYYGVHIVNTNKEILQRCKEIIDHISSDKNDLKDKALVKPKNYKKAGFKNKPLSCYQITLRRKETIRRVLEEVLPLLTEKRKKSQILLHYLNNHIPRSRMTDEEIERWLSFTPVETEREAL